MNAALHVGRHLAERHHGAALEAEVGDEAAVGGVDLGRLVRVVPAQLGDGRAAVAGAGTGPERRQGSEPEGDDREERDEHDATGARGEPNALQEIGLPAGHAPKLAGCGARFQRVRYAPMSDILELLTARGFVQDATPGLAERLRQGPITAYVGFDPTADSLHVGNMVPADGAWPGCSGWATPPSRWSAGDRHGGRSERQARGAPGHVARPDRPQRPGAHAPAPAVPDVRGSQRGPAPEQRRLASRAPADGVSARHRQALHPEPHAAEGVGAEPDGDRGFPTPSSATC